jgi:ATP-dependent DNA helicase RecG
MFREDSHVELKRELTDDLKKEVIAFANCEGGNIYIGIDDTGEVTGIENSDDVLNKVTNMVRDFISPDITLFVGYKVKVVDNKTVIIIEVQQGTRKPYYLSSKGLKSTGVFVRQGASASPASQDAIRKMIIMTDGDNYEDIRSFNQELTFEYIMEEFEKRNIEFGESQMVTLGFVTGQDRVYTNAGLLFSDQAVHTIKAAVFEGKTKKVFHDRQEYKGSILKQLEEIYHYMDMFNRTRAEISGLYRVDRRDYPEVAIRETLLNAIIHREYLLSGSTLVSVFDDRIEFVTIGGLVEGITLDDVLFGVSMARNEKIANVFYRLKLVEAYGTGISKVMDSYKNEGRKPKIEVSNNAFKVTLYNRNYSWNNENLSESQQHVMEIYESKTYITRKDVEKELGISQTMAGRIIKQLVEKECVSVTGSGSNTRYIIRKD